MGARPSSFHSRSEEKRVTAMMASKPAERVWLEQQQDIFRWFEQVDPDHNPNLVVRARAGTGKTTTIIEGVNRVPESSILVCAFNKKIAEELNSRIDNSSAVAKTLHSVGYQAIRREWGGIPVAKGNTRAEYLTNLVGGKTMPPQIHRLVTQLHTKARDMVPTSATREVLTDLAEFFDLVPDEGWGQYDLEFVVGSAYAAVQHAAICKPTHDTGIDFADMIFLPLVWSLLSKDYDLVVVDEAQDLTVAQLTTAQRVCSGRICLVGDDKQAIYGFRGADSGSLDRLKGELQALELPLTMTFRCAQAIVRRAQGLVPDIQAGPSNPEGTVDALGHPGMLEGVLPGEFILSRLNAPLVSITLQLLRQGKRARMAGRDLGAGILAILNKLKCYDRTPIEDLMIRLEEWERKTTTRLAASGRLELVDRTRDQANMIRALVTDGGIRNTGDFIQRCQWLFTDDVDTEQILCSSVHKAKGLEAGRVYILQESLYRRGTTQEEKNIEYVATTRAKQHLTLVTGVPGLQSRR